MMKLLTSNCSKNEQDDDLIVSANHKLLRMLLVSFLIPSKVCMMPLKPSSTDSAQKPKIGFSIDDIVGADRRNLRTSSTITTKQNLNRSQRFSSTNNEPSQYDSASSSPEPIVTDNLGNTMDSNESVTETVNPFAQLHSFPNNLFNNNSSFINNVNANHQRPITFLNHFHHQPPHGTNNSSISNSPEMASPPNICTTAGNQSGKINRKEIPLESNYYERINGMKTYSEASPSPSPPVITIPSRSPSPLECDSRTSPISNSPDVNHGPTLYYSTQGPPPPHLPTVGPHGLPQFTYPQSMINFAAAAAVAASAHNPGLPGWIPDTHKHYNSFAAHPLYPWLLAKHSRLFPNHFGPGPDLPGFLLQQFHKPKRIRTAFSPSQLLKLEHAFERNNYVVGTERKQLANSLSLSETQIKVWFQNRRTKQKRIQQDEETAKKSGCVRGGTNRNGSSGSNLSTNAISADSSTKNYISEEMMGEGKDGEEEIIMDEHSDQEEEIAEHLHQQTNRTT